MKLFPERHVFSTIELHLCFPEFITQQQQQKTNQKRLKHFVTCRLVIEPQTIHIYILVFHSFSHECSIYVCI